MIVILLKHIQRSNESTKNSIPDYRRSFSIEL